MADRTVGMRADAEAGSGAPAARRWNSRAPPRRAGEGTPDRASHPTASTRVSQPSRSPSRDWGVLLAIVGSVVFLVAAAVTYSVMVGGLLGLLTIRDAIGLSAALVALGGLVLYRGWRAYRGG